MVLGIGEEFKLSLVVETIILVITIICNELLQDDN